MADHQRVPEHSAGAVIVTRFIPRRFRGSAHPETRATKERRDYLVLHYEAGHWDFPKGHLEEGETEEVAAKREIMEETGLSVDRFVPEYREETAFWFWSYPEVPGGKSRRTKKIVTFFLAETSDRDVRLSDEHTGYAWLPYKEALQLVTYDNARNLLKRAERYFRRLENPQQQGDGGRHRRRRRGGGGRHHGGNANRNQNTP